MAIKNTIPPRFLKRTALFLAVSLILTSIPFSFALPARAAITDWQRGATILGTHSTDFSSESFRQSLRDLKSTGANSVALVVPYYQSAPRTIDIAPGGNTPTDESLGSAIDYAHSLGLSVTLNFQLYVYTGDWRAYINPDDRTGWYLNYGNALAHVASIAQTHRAEMIVIGTELVYMASDINPSNTQNWINIINRIRSIYNGKLTYSANSNTNDGNNFTDEKRHIQFWSYLDYAGLSAYYGLGWSGDDVQTLKNAWDFWNTNDLRSFQASVNKPLMFIEIGYRSLDNSYQDPWNWSRGGNVNLQTQANTYEAVLSYWNDHSYIAGLYFWNWSSDPNAGGNSSTDYTPQYKPAQDTMARWFTNPSTPPPQPPSGTPAFTSSGSANPGGTTVGNTVTLMAVLKNDGAAMPTGIIDIEVYDSSNNRVFQQFFFLSTAFNTGETRTFNVNWTTGTAGTHKMKIGVFNGDWSRNYHWNDAAAVITVNGSSNPPPPPPPNNPPPNNPPPSGNQVTNIWWPTDGANVSGLQPFKAMLENIDISQYRMYWRVGDGQLNEMYNEPTDYPHKEALVDLSGWRWAGNGPYRVTFVSKNTSGAIISEKTVAIYVQ